ncbi:MAG: TMEM175 family protein, partial [Thermoleophilia bacterium]
HMVGPHDTTPPPAPPQDGDTGSRGAAADEGRRASFEVNETGRVETFSDSVFAIAATLLVLTLHVPSTHVSDAALWHELLARWPTDVAFVISFLSILIMWSNHHGVFNVIQRVDHTFLLLNGLLLLGITATPFTTTLLADNLGHASERAGALVYSGVLLFVAAAFVALWLYASRGRRLLVPGITAVHIAAVTRQFAFGPVAFALAFALAFASAKASVAVLVAIEIFYAIPSRATRAITPD